ARFLSAADGTFVVEGLPGRLSTLSIDGLPFHTAGADPAASLRAGAFALSGFDAAQLITTAADVEWASSAAGILAAYTQRGSTRSAGQVFGSWSGGPLATSSIEGDVSAMSIQGGATLRGSLGSGGLFNLGGAVQRRETAVSPAWSASDAATQLIAADAGGLGLAGYAEPAAVGTDVFGGFA